MRSPWKSNAPVDTDRTYVAVATKLTSHRLRSTGRMFRGARRTAKQMCATPGCVGFASLARPLRKQYRSLSLWESEEARAGFVHSGAHGALVSGMGHEVASFETVHWTVAGDTGRPTWREGFDRLDRVAVDL
jgi:heme-degrading monooxygenase HmoA